nr:MAG TPA: hypothetical protein [Caudoviricetes sp.]
MMNESNNACCVPQEAPAILAVAEENAKMIEIANTRVESILRKLRGDRPIPQTEGCRAEPTFGAMRQLTESQQRQLNRLLNSIEELDSLI